MINKEKLLFLLLCFVSSLWSQHSISISGDIQYFKTGKTLFDNGQYVAANQAFQTFIDCEQPEYIDRVIEAKYYIVYSNYLQDKDGVENELLAFVNEYDGSLFANDLNYELGRFYFRSEKYRYSIKSFEKCKEEWLTSEQLSFFYYEYAYAYFSERKYTSAKPLFKTALDSDSEFKDEALYYYSFLQYRDKNYTVALDGFESLYDDDKFIDSAPYYMAQIYFIKEDYDKLVDIAPSLLGEEGSANDAELNRIIGDAYYSMKDYDNAIVYLEAYQNLTRKILRQDLYHLGVAYYMQKDYSNAAETLAQVTVQNDHISQSAYSFLGECFVRLDDKERACLAFGTASKYEFDKAIQEDAYYNHVKLSYQTSVSPFNGSISLLESFLKEFPTSEYRTEIYSLMYQSYMSTTNYADACQSISRMKLKDPRMSMASQRVHYYRGIELYNTGDYKLASIYFINALEGEALEKKIKAKTLFWLGDTYYQLSDYTKAMAEYNRFITSPGAYSLKPFTVAHYNMGYCFFKSNNYNAAINWFRKFNQLDKTVDINMITDAHNRVADCFYLKRDFNNAIKYYSKAIESEGQGIEYAYFQKGFCQGLMNMFEPKIVTLNTLLKVYPESVYADDAMYEVAKSWSSLERFDDAIKVYKELPLAYPHSKYASKSLLNAGLTYYNIGELDNSIASYKELVSDYNGTEDARAAMLALKNISIDQNSVNDYIAFAKEVGGDMMQVSEEDSLNFLAAEKLYMAQRFDDAITAFASYNTSYPKGAYVLMSNFYMADAYMQQSRYEEAMPCLEYIVSQPRNIYTEQSLAVLSATYYNEKQYGKALDTYKRLLDNAERKENVLAAKEGIVDCNYALSEAGATILAVDNLLVEILSPLVSNKALYYKAKSYIALGNKIAAKESFLLLINDLSNAYGAEAKYTIAQMYFDEGEMQEAKDETLDFINKGTPQQYWLAKSFILLSDIYISEGDYFQAKQYLLSISDNYKGDDDILGIVNEKIAVITLQEEQQNQKDRDSISARFVEPVDSIN